MSLIPTSLLVRCRLPVRKIDSLPRSAGAPLDLPAECRLMFPSELEEHCDWARLSAAWNERGLAFQLEVSGRKVPVLGRPETPTEPDSFELWIDTRETQSVHRATRDCHHFCVLPNGGGDQGLDAITIQQPVARAREDSPRFDWDHFLCSAQRNKSGYVLSVWLPAETLTGFDPVQQPRLGFSARVNDAEHGRLHLGVGAAFAAEADPSLWHSLELREAAAPRSKSGTRAR